MILDRVIDEIQAENHFTRTEVEKLIHYVVSFTKDVLNAIFSPYFSIYIS
jgi:hypothetical protein